MTPEEILLSEQTEAVHEPLADYEQSPSMSMSYWGGTCPADAGWVAGTSGSTADYGHTPLLDGYIVPDGSGVQDYVRMHPRVESALIRAREIADDRFDNPTLRLLIGRLPSENWHPKLVLHIESGLDRGKVLERFEEFDSEFWAEQPSSVDEELRITLE